MSRKILVIDDEQGPRFSLKMALKGEYEVLLAESVDAGLALLRSHAPDLVITDVRMPGKNGIQGLEELRRIDPDVAVVILTGFGDLATARQAIQRGADDYVRKPYDLEEMRKVAAEQIARTDARRRRTASEQSLAAQARDLERRLSEQTPLAKLGIASSSLVHDLRNPLGVISGYVDMLHLALQEAEERGQAPEEAMSFIQPIMDGIRTCVRISEDWKALGNRDRLAFEPVPLFDLVTGIGTRMSRPGGTPVHIACPEDCRGLQIRADRNYLTRALQNIVENALLAAPPPKGRVTLRVSRGPEGSLNIAVDDNGPGIPPHLVEKIFEPFYTTRRGKGGTGLGLFIARTVAEDHGGVLRVETKPDQGTTFHLCLPATS